MLIAHEHQHNETMLQLLQMIDGYEPPLEAPAPLRAGGRPGPEMVARRGRRPRDRSPPDPASPTTTSDRAHEVAVAPFRIDRRPVSNGDFAAFVAETGADPPLYWERDGAGGWVTHHLRTSRRARSRTLRWSTSTIARRRPSPRGRASDCRPSSNGRSPPSGADADAANLDHGGLRHASRRRPGSESACNALGMIGDVWEWTDSELDRLPGLRGLSLPRVLRGLLRPRLPGAAGRILGDPAQRRSAPPSATGTCPSADRSSPASAA